MPLTVFGANNSTRAQIVLLMLEELGLEYEFELVDLTEGERQVGMLLFISYIKLTIPHSPTITYNSTIIWPRHQLSRSMTTSCPSPALSADFSQANTP